MPDETERYELTGFPAVVIPFVRAMEANRLRTAARHGLTSIEFRALFIVAESRSLTPKQLAEGLGVSNGAVTGLADRLIAAGLIKREAHPNDRRSLHLTLAAGGHRTMRSIHDGLNAMLDAAVASIDEAQLDQASAVLRQVTESISASDAATAP